jgi:hypothetical protein
MTGDHDRRALAGPLDRYPLLTEIVARLVTAYQPERICDN